MNQIRYLNEKKNQLIYNNFKYQYDQFQIQINPNLKCTATLSILNDQVIPSKEHNHTPMFECESEYLFEISKLKDISLIFSSKS